MKLISLQEKIKALGGLKAADLSPWEEKFCMSVIKIAFDAAQAGQVTALTEKQIEKIDQIYDRHFNVAED
jgi:hypothetical protein